MGETMLGTKLDWLCNAIVALVLVLAPGLGLDQAAGRIRARARSLSCRWLGCANTQRDISQI